MIMNRVLTFIFVLFFLFAGSFSYCQTIKDKQLDQNRTTEIVMKGRKLSDDEAQALQNQFDSKQEDLSIASQLLGYYFHREFNSESMRNAHQKIVLWIIQNHPESEVAGIPQAALNPTIDKQAYYEAERLWQTQIEKNPQNAAILGNAANFFLIFNNDLAEDLLKKAQAIEPENPEWPERLGNLYSMEMIGKPASEKQKIAAESLKQTEESMNLDKDEMNRFYKLTDLAKAAFEAGDLTKAEAYAEEILNKAPQYKNDWNYGNAIFYGNMVLGRIALKSGDLAKAKEYLLESGKTPGSPALNSFGPNMTLAKELLDKGEKETVVQFFQLCENFWKMDRGKLKEWAILVKGGAAPDFSSNLSY